MISKKRNSSFWDVLGVSFMVLGILMLAKSVSLCFCNDIWYDELFTVGMIEHSYGELVAFTARDVHPPLYYCITKCIVDLCKLIDPAVSAIIVAKIVSVLPFFLLAIYGMTFVRKHFGSLTAGLFVFCTIAMPQLSEYTVEIRMYSWAMLFVTAALLHAYGTLADAAISKAADSVPQTGGAPGEQTHMIAARRLHSTALVLYGLAAAYTQYFACVAMVMVYLYVLLVFLMRDRSRLREWLLWVAISVLGYMPWLFTLISQITAVRENYWIQPLTWRSIGGCVKFILKPSFTNDTLNIVLAAVFFLVCLFLFLRYGVKKEKLYHNGRVLQNDSDSMQKLGLVLAGVAVLVGVVLFGFAASVLLRPIFVYRYMIPAMGCFWLAFAVCLSDFCVGATSVPTVSSGQKVTAYGILLLVIVVGLRDYRAFLGEEEYKALLMQDTQTALASIAPEDTVIYNFDQVQAVTSYYMEDSVESYLWCGTPEPLIQDIIRPYDTVEDVAEVAGLVEEQTVQGGTVWFVGSFNSRDDIVDEWRQAGLTVEEQGSYLLERYWFNLYKITE
jgi:hypothetical protein